MINSVKNLPPFALSSPAAIKIASTLRFYKNSAQFFSQDEKTFISLLDGDLTLVYGGTDLEELKSFINFLPKKSLFADFEFLKKAGFLCKKNTVVKLKEKPLSPKIPPDTKNSKDVYDLLNVPLFSLPDYEFFATDYCRKLNGSGLFVYAIKNVCAALGIKEGSAALLLGVVSRKKGMGRVAVSGVLDQLNAETVFAVTKTDLLPFYLKCGFEPFGNCGYYIF